MADPNRRRSPNWSLVVLALLPFASGASGAAGASDWPHWRGPDHNGFSSETALPSRWSETENVVWKLAMPSVSGATPIISGDLVFLNVGDGDTLELWAVDRASGTPRWKRPLGPGNHVTRKQNMSSPSPVTDGKRVWALTGTGVLRGFDFEGRELWARDLQAEYGKFGLNWGYGSSPLYAHDTLFVQVLHGMKTDDPSYVVAIDPATGENRWRVERPTDARMESPDSYSTPAILDLGERHELVVTGGDYVTGHDLTSGREVWRLAGLNPEKQAAYRIVASPVVAGSMIYVPSRVSPLLALDASGAVPVVAWRLERGTDVPTPATDGMSFFLVNDRGLLQRLDARTGAEVWPAQRLAQGVYSASPVVADHKLYATNETGVTSVVAIDGDFRLITENTLEGYSLASPAISGGRLFLRNDRFLYCIGLE